MPIPYERKLLNKRIVQVALDKIGQTFCRHNYVLVQANGKLFLRCPNCTRETVGIVPTAMEETR